MCLHLIAFASPKLTILQLQQAVSICETHDVCLDDSNLISEYEIASRCSSLIRKSENGNHFEFSHFSVQEFLTSATLRSSPALGRYFLSKSGSHTLIATQCLRFLQLKNFERRPESSKMEAAHISRRIREYPFYEYAAVLWPNFARGRFQDSLLSNVANSLFQRPKTAHFLAWSVEFLRHFTTPSNATITADDLWMFPRSEVVDTDIKHYVSSVSNGNFSPLHLAAAFGIPGICTFLLDDKSDLNLSCAWGSPLELVTASFTSFYELPAKEIWDLGHCWRFDLGPFHLTALENRSTAIELLVRAGAEVTSSPSRPASYLLDSSFLLASISFDLSPVTKILSLGVELGPESGYESFMVCMES